MTVETPLPIAMHTPFNRLLQAAFFVIAYVLIDWATYMHPLHGLNITPWNPPPAIAFALWLHFGRVVAIPWFIALFAAEILIRDMPVSLFFTLMLSTGMIIGYGVMAESMRRRIKSSELIRNQQQLLAWVMIVFCGTLFTSSFYVLMVYHAGLIPAGERAIAMFRFWMGDCVGIVVTMPFCGMLFERNGRKRLREALLHWETAGYALLGVCVMWIAFGLDNGADFKYFYLLFLPIVWAAARQGLTGAAIAAFVLPTGIIIAALWTGLVAVTVFDLQMLGAVLAFVGFYIGIGVDERQRVNMELQQTLRLAAAGEMAAALAHELNQPLTALSAYGAASEQLLAQGDTGTQLLDTIRRMVAESRRAADVVRRLRDFFRTGATQLEEISVAELIEAATFSFSAKAMRNGINLKIDRLPDCILLIDRLQIEVVLRNLLSNAFDAVSERPILQRRIDISAQRNKTGQICIRVEDSGTGVSAAMAERLFEAFRSSKTSGLGLGLPISRAIVEAHGGSLNAEVADHGVFELVLPVEENNPDVE